MSDTHNYQVELMEQCREWWADYEASIAANPETTFDWPSFLHAFVKGIALASFKNGIEAGQRRAAGKQSHSTFHRRPPAQVKGTALANGKLRRVESTPATQV